MKETARTFTILLALILLAFIAAGAGLFLAMWDTNSTVNEVYEMAFPNRIIVADTQTIEFESSDLNVLKGFEPPKFEDKGGNIKELTDNGGVKGLMSASKDETETEQSDVEEEEKETPVEKEEERAPLAITSEISGIEKVVRAGDEGDTLVNSLPSPAQVSEVSAENIDPMADYPLPYTEVDLSYFDDALFIGDSRVAGLAMNSGTNATFYAVTSFQLYKYKTFKVVQTPNGKVPIFDVMPYDKFTKIYIKVGLNELGTVTDEPFIEAYTSFINDLRAMQPRAIIYIQAILPVTQVKSQTDRVHCNENILKRNENLKSFAELMKCYYVDAGPYFADETGALKAETTADGIHMYSKYMPQWIDALSKQAVIWPPVN
ncbi:MAG: GDSL-type esterase/lipase family protein [Lachnospiraceae bacterium]|nr:GDSL-type esterase/lipase family protein [Lachnospiraceae bacterium]